MSLEEITRQQSTKAGFIRAYGMFWHAGEVDWTGEETGRYRDLLGRVGKNRRTLQVANFWEQQGIYVLYNDHGAYYVGQTSGDGMNLGKRLRQHYLGQNNSPHSGKWDRFCWFGWRGTLSSVDPRGLRRLRKTPSRLLTTSQNTIRDIESLLIHTLGTLHVANARQETFVAAVEWEQVAWHERERYLRKALEG